MTHRQTPFTIACLLVMLCVAASLAPFVTPAHAEDAEVTVTASIGPFTLDAHEALPEIDLLTRFDDPLLDLARFNTVLGSFDVKLFKAQTPLTVANFLAYVDDGSYTNSFIHRSVPDFVIQGGGFAFYDFDDPDPETGDYIRLPTRAPVLNEPGISNLRGTIAMAKLGGDPDSATNQWFINLADNSRLDLEENNEFTVFGEVIGVGMSIVDAIALEPIWNASVLNGAFDTLPLIDFANVGVFPDETNLVMVWSIERIHELTFTVTVDRPDLVSVAVGGSTLNVRPTGTATGTATVTVRATALDGRYAEQSFQVTITDRGDFTGDNVIDLADAVEAFRAASGMGTDLIRSDYPTSGADANGDGHLGMEDAVYVLGVLSRYQAVP